MTVNFQSTIIIEQNNLVVPGVDQIQIIFTHCAVTK